MSKTSSLHVPNATVVVFPVKYYIPDKEFVEDDVEDMATENFNSLFRIFKITLNQGLGHSFGVHKLSGKYCKKISHKLEK